MVFDPLLEKLVALYKETASCISEDVLSIYKKSLAASKKENLQQYTLSNIMDNIAISGSKQIALCQDTGIPVWYVKLNKNNSMKEVSQLIVEATKIATKNFILRPNAVNSFTGKNTGDNAGFPFPIIHFEENTDAEIAFNLLLKGGGCENIGAMYSLPSKELDAERNIEGVEKCIIDAVMCAQGRGCPPYIVSATIGGTRESACFASCKSFLRKIDEKNTDLEIAKEEENILKKINSLGIGPMGFGGSMTASAVFLTFLHRHPASYFVDVSFFCWAMRRGSLVWK
ncbi:MAG: fumarate hydratase [archaeon]